MKRLALTGSAGYIGQNLRPVLEADGWDVAGYDLADEREYLDLLKEWATGFDAIVHCAAFTKLASNSQEMLKMVQNNVAFLAVLCDSLRKIRYQGPFVFLSSSAVYSPETGLAGRTKQLGETIVRESLPQAAIIRPFNVVGGAVLDIGHDRLLPKLKVAVDMGEPFQVYGTGQHRRSYVHVRGVIESVRYALSGYPNAVPMLLDVWSPRYVSVHEVLALVGRHLGKFVPVQQGPDRRENPGLIVPDSMASRVYEAGDDLGDAIKEYFEP